MSRSDRTEWPSRSFIDELREEGTVSYAVVAGRCLIVLTFALVALLLSGTAASLWKDYLGLLQHVDGSRPADFFVGLKQLGSAAIPTLAAPFAVLAVEILLFGLLQTRFSICFGHLAFKPERFFGLRRLSALNCFGRVALAVGLGLVALLAGYLTFTQFLPVFASALNGSASDLPWYSAQSLGALGLVFVPTLIGLAVLSLTVQWLWFRHSNRMTRKEVEAEARSN